jgi:hypothetical protein
MISSRHFVPRGLQHFDEITVTQVCLLGVWAWRQTRGGPRHSRARGGRPAHLLYRNLTWRGMPLTERVSYLATIQTLAVLLLLSSSAASPLRPW